MRTTATTTSSNVDVVCAFPLSSNYGPGSRILYYLLVAACVAFRKVEWLRNACLAAALVLPAISALQALVLAASHSNGVVDLDLYGAFQFCAIGILAAPLTVRISRTYFYDPGRNIIFLWTILLLMGLISLCVEFYRVSPTDCRSDLNNSTRPFDAAHFPYGNVQCGMRCSEEAGPFSRMRGGAAANVNIVPVPRILTFNAAMLLAAGFCIPAILSLIFTWDKILEINWRKRAPAEQPDEVIEGANMTVRELKGINNVVRKFLGVIEVPLFGGVIITLIGVGEANFYSAQVQYDTEPMAAIGQWSPIAGTLLAALGSLYLLWASDDKNGFTEKSRLQYDESSPRLQSDNSRQQQSPNLLAVTHNNPGRHSGENALGIRSPSPTDIGLITTITHPESVNEHREHVSEARQNEELPTAGRQRVRRWFNAAGDYWANAAHEKLDVSDFNDPRAHRFPEIPGEIFRNPLLEQISRDYTQRREDRANSTYAASIISTPGLEQVNTPPPTVESPRPETSPSRKPKRRDTLEVPTPAHLHRRNGSQ
ncbi:hypothetical protein T440DRAFT_389978 [Plenodomus tracheiphilus IPT5]|uniref:Uncharacterized protein n=1 Tax=Plenodomus tracheiphilus IPT5 TaxID=1408161 RepID=A0A6A7BHH3_9PLEO|nr:hypothetical protein T440DRAFT_389978 [Plenodomus tracheiphilus IPT5]